MAEIKIGGKYYPIRFDLNSMAEVQKRYGDVTSIKDRMTDLAELRWLLAVLINEGVAYERVMNGVQAEGLTEEKLGMLLSPADLGSPAIVDAIVASFNDCLGDDQKKMTAEELAEIASHIPTTK